MKITFLYKGEEDLDGVRNWDPEADPMRFPSALGHGFFQLFLAIRELYPSVELSKQTNGSDVYVVMQKLGSYRFRQQFSLLREMFSRDRMPTIVAIHADGRNKASTFLVHKNVVPNSFRLKSAYDAFIPMLPQNGLKPREAKTLTRNLVAYGHSFNFPSHLFDELLVGQLAKAGINLRRADQNGAQPDQILDFRDALFTLCLRKADKAHILAYKPPTRLVNAWMAGTIPIIDREPGYFSLATPGVDCLLVSTDHKKDPQAAKAEIYELLTGITDAEIERMLVTIREKKKHYSKENIARAHLDFFFAPVPGRAQSNFRLKLLFHFFLFPLKRFARFLYKRERRFIERMYRQE